MIIQPMFDFEIVCPGCQFDVKVRIWNGVNNFDMIPDILGMTTVNTINTIVQCEYEFAHSIIEHCYQQGPHAADFILIWARDDKTYELLVKLAENYHHIVREDDDGDEEHHHGH